ncbi:MAG: helix-turn-helix domain-containing protein [Myxococcales bacterium]|nr:helix-turn-helix domain-containing protein [Myxococcales bacterium]
MDGLLAGIGGRVRALRRQRRLTLRALASASGLSERFVSGLEAGRTNVSVLSLSRIADALGAPIASLLSGAGERRVIALLGLRGAGKSTVGRALAAKLEIPFHELDRLVEVEAGMSLSELFALHGEEYFRSLERTALERFLSREEPAVLATGGGLVTSPESHRLLMERARTVWLRAEPKEHWERVVRQGDLRPMRGRPQAMAELERRLDERAPLYAKAERTCSTSGRSVAKVVAELCGAFAAGAAAPPARSR